jgi:hypothetical protein
LVLGFVPLAFEPALASDLSVPDSRMRRRAASENP